MLSLYENFCSLFSIVCSFKFLSKNVVLIMIFPNSPPYAPAFIFTAPPRVPGIPHANSKPDNPFSYAVLARTGTATPDPTSNFSPSICIFLKLGFIVIPLIPLSLTSKLVPLPMQVTSVLLSLAIFKTCFNSSKSFTTIKISAGPPILNDVCLLIGSLIKTLSLLIFSVNSLYKSSIFIS